MPFAATWMDLEDIMLSRIIQREKDKYCMISLICGIKKIHQIQTKYKNRSRLYRHREQTLVVISGESKGGAQEGWGVGGTNLYVESKKYNKWGSYSPESACSPTVSILSHNKSSLCFLGKKIKLQQTSEYNKKKKTHRYRERTSGYHGRWQQEWERKAQTFGCGIGSKVYCTTQGI